MFLHALALEDGAEFAREDGGELRPVLVGRLVAGQEENEKRRSLAAMTQGNKKGGAESGPGLRPWPGKTPGVDGEVGDEYRAAGGDVRPVVRG